MQVDKGLIKRELFVTCCAVLASVLASFWVFNMSYYWNYTTLGNHRHPSFDLRILKLTLISLAWLSLNLFIFCGAIWAVLRRKFIRSPRTFDLYYIFVLLGIVTTCVFSAGSLAYGFFFTERWRAPDPAGYLLYCVLLGVAWGSVCWKFDSNTGNEKRPVIANILGMVLVTNLAMAFGLRASVDSVTLMLSVGCLLAAVTLFFSRPTGQLLSKVAAGATILLSFPILFTAILMMQFTVWPDTIWVGTLPAVVGLFAIGVAIRALATSKDNFSNRIGDVGA